MGYFDNSVPTYPLRALVVDDIPEISFALAHFLGGLCPGGTRVANSAAEAIRMMEMLPVDLIICDLSMPERDGLSLLAEVQARWPATVRVILTGQSHWEAALAAVPHCHQFLSKPTELQHLGALVNRLKVWIEGKLDPLLADAVGGISVLPSCKNTLLSLRALLAEGLPRSADLAAIVRRDPALCARVLQIGNASFFGGGSRLHDVDGAVSLVGPSCMRDLLSKNALAAEWPTGKPLPFDLERFSRHSMVVAQVAKATLRDPRAAETAYTAGLLHGLGNMVLAAAKPQLFSLPPENLGELPQRLGAQLLTFWGLPSQIVSAVANSAEPPDEDTFGPTSAVYLARKVACVAETAVTGPIAPETPLSDDFVLRHGLRDTLAKLVDKATSAELMARRTLSPPPVYQNTI